MRRSSSLALALTLALSMMSCAQQAGESPIAPSNAPRPGTASPDLREPANATARTADSDEDAVSIAQVLIDDDGGSVGSQLAAKTCVIRGTLVDKLTYKPLPKATAIFKSDGKSYTVTTDSKGAFSITLPCGVYLMTVTVNGTTSKAVQITFTKSASNVRVVVVVPPKALPPKCDLNALYAAYDQCERKYWLTDKGAWSQCMNRAASWSNGGCKPWPFTP